MRIFFVYFWVFVSCSLSNKEKVIKFFNHGAVKILGYVILASKDVLDTSMQYFTNQITCCLKCVKSYLREREEGGIEKNSCSFYRISDVIVV